MTKILQVCVDGNMGSTGRIAETIGKLAISHGWESYIAHGRFKRPSESHIIQIGSRFDVFMHGIQTRLFDRNGLGSRQATLKFVERIKAIRPDLIHLHHLHGYYINIKILFNYLAQESIPVVWTFHDCWSITGHCTHFDFVGCEKWKSECNNCPQIKEYPASIFVDRSKKNFYLKKTLFTSVKNLTIVSVSNWLNNIVGVSFLEHKSRLVIYNGIDIDLFSPKSDKSIRLKYQLENKFMIFGVARPWNKRKGLNDFIALSKKIKGDTIIVLVGLNDNQINTLPKNIIGLPGTENQSELSNFYDSADLYMNLSVQETFGLTTAEALACGTPAVVYNATACPEIIDEYTGIVVRKNDINGLLDSIETIKKNGKASYSIACRERAVKLFNKNDRFMEYISLYEKMLEK